MVPLVEPYSYYINQTCPLDHGPRDRARADSQVRRNLPPGLVWCYPWLFWQLL